MSEGELLRSIETKYNQYVDAAGSDTLGENIKSGRSGGKFGNISDDDYEYLLIFDENLPMFHELPYRVLFHLPEMMINLAVPQGTHDHSHYWAWTAEVLKVVNEGENCVESELEGLFHLMVDFAVGSIGSVPVSKQLWEENKKLRRLVSPHVQRAMAYSSRAVTQLSYPFLEGILRRLCDDDVRLDGMIKNGQTVRKMDGSEEKSGRINNPGDLLSHFETRVAEQETRGSLQAVKKTLETYSNSHKGYSVVNSWRHPHSHGGEKFAGSEYVVLLNIACQLVWSCIPQEEYEEIQKGIYTEKILNGETLPGSTQELDFSDYYPLKETRDLVVEQEWSPKSA